MSETSQDPLQQVTGGCSCGKVHFEVNAPLVGAARCYCKRCQRRTGTAFSQTALTQPGSFGVTEGEEFVKFYEPGDGGWNKGFCSECGSHLLTRNAENPDLLAVRMGSLDEDPHVPVRAHQFVKYAPPWYEIPDDGIQRFDERMTYE
ncbi:MAG: GFA family protein [Solirubrobacterales bacterium]